MQQSSELEALRQETEQLKNQIRVSYLQNLFFILSRRLLNLSSIQSVGDWQHLSLTNQYVLKLIYDF